VTAIISDNRISSNAECGILLFRTRGCYRIEGNHIQDNGQGHTHADGTRDSGITIYPPFRRDQKIAIRNNTFVSSAGSDTVGGQLVSILNVKDQGDAESQETTNYIEGNQFLFHLFNLGDNPLASPVPCSFGILINHSSGQMELQHREIANVRGNINSKITANDILL